MNFIEGENFTEEKYKNEFIVVENNYGFNYMNLILVLNNIFIYTRQIDKNDESKVNKLLSDFFDFKTFLNTDYYLDFGNLKINSLPNNPDMSFEEVYNLFDKYFYEIYENLLPTQSINEQKEKEVKYTYNIFNNIISVYQSSNQNLEYTEKKQEKINYMKIKQNLIKFKEYIPKKIQYIIQVDAMNLESNENTINPSLFKKNRFGLYFNPIDESLLYEIIYFNKKLEHIQTELDILISMLEGKFYYDFYHIESFEILDKDNVPKELNIYYDIQGFNKNISFPVYKEILNNRISIFRNWLSEGSLNCYHLPLFNNLELFFYTIKMHFCRKYYGENDFAKVSPDLIRLRFFTTKYPTYNELSSNEKDFKYYNKTFHNEIIWVDGLVLNNATIDSSNKHLTFSNTKKNVKQKLNVVGISYIVEQNENEEYSDENEEEEGEYEEEEEEKYEQIEEDEDKKEEKNKEDKKDENISPLKIYIYGNKKDVNTSKYYRDDPLGYFEFKIINKENNGQDYIYENDIKITIEDFDIFQ